jgi:ribosomal protein L37AE/L43A
VENLLSAKAGEVARETAAYRCEKCNHRQDIRAGALISECSNCGNASFKTGWNIALVRPGRAEADALFEKA